MGAKDAVRHSAVESVSPNAERPPKRFGAILAARADGTKVARRERKRMFMAMKREVLRTGGYTQEYFVSQTPELAAMADVVFDLDALRSGRQAENNLLTRG